jgi:amidase
MLRLGASADLGFAPVAQSVRAAFEAAVGKLSASGLHVERAHPDCSGADAAFKTLRAGIMHSQNRALVARSRDKLTAPFVWNVERGAGLSADDFVDAEKTRGEVYARFMRFFEDHDALLTPSAAVPPILNTVEDIMEIDGERLETVIDYLAITYAISLIGMPCLSIPCGFFADGLPVGMQIVVPPYCESRLLAIAGHLEANFGFAHRWPTETVAEIQTASV